VTACSPDDHDCEQFSKCSIRDPLWKIRTLILDALSTVTVAELASDGDPATIPMMLVPSGTGRVAAGE